MRLSLRARLLVAVLAVAAVGLLVADVATFAALRSFLDDRVDRSLDDAHRPVENVLDRFGPEIPAVEALAAVAPGYFIQYRDQNGQVLTTVPYGPHDRPLASPRLPDRITGVGTDTGPAVSPEGNVVRFTVPATDSGGPQFRVRVSRVRSGILIMAVSTSDVTDTLHRLVSIEIIVFGAVVVAALLLGLWLVRVGLHPLSDIGATANSIAAGDLTQRVQHTDERTEVGRLGTALNVMLGHIEESFEERKRTEAELRRSDERLRRFVSDASHELRTPIAAIQAYAELFERGADRRPDDLARVMEGIQGETRRMGSLVDDLLLLARLDEGRPLERNDVELVALAAEAVQAARVVGPGWPVTLEAPAPVEIAGDAHRLRQVLDNLLANVRAHTPAGTPAVVRVSADEHDAVIEVADQGPGLGKDEAARAFERFYRADPSRSRQNGGTGLGLAIVAAIVHAQGGTIALDTTPGRGATFRISLPRTPEARPAEPPTVPPAEPPAETGP